MDFLSDFKEYSDTEPASASGIEDAERRLKVKLPQLLKELYLVRNGGPVRMDTYVDPATGAEHVPLYDGLESLDGMESIQTLSESIDFGDPDEDWSLRLPHSEKLIILSRHALEWVLCLDYRNSGPETEPEVVYFDYDLRELLRVSSFKDFVAKLRPNEYK